MQKSQLMTVIILKNKKNPEKQLKGVKNSAKTQGFIGKTQDFTKSRTQSIQQTHESKVLALESTHL